MKNVKKIIVVAMLFGLSLGVPSKCIAAPSSNDLGVDGDKFVGVFNMKAKQLDSALRLKSYGTLSPASDGKLRFYSNFSQFLRMIWFADPKTKKVVYVLVVHDTTSTKSTVNELLKRADDFAEAFLISVGLFNPTENKAMLAAVCKSVMMKQGETRPIEKRAAYKNTVLLSSFAESETFFTVMAKGALSQ